MFTHLPHLNQVRGFEAAARLGSFKAAGEELNLSPTAISHQIANLEDKLGILLFERRTRSVILTREGSKLAQAAHQALQQLSTALEEISNTKSVLRITTTTSFASMWLVPNLASFQEKYPEIQIEIKTGEDLIDINRDRRIDLAIRYGKYDEKNAHMIKLVTEHFGAYATEDYLNRHKDLKVGTLIETQWKNKNLPSITWRNWLQAFRPDMPIPKISCFDQEHHAIQAALAGQGVVLVSSVLAKMAIQQGWLKPLDGNCSMPGFTYYLLVSPFSGELRKVIAFTEWLVEELSENT
ncbi:DNA-binding transcriptional regulator, LysR family [Nitrosomonas marina]|uniref:DNA-binding transcriptional regulator, LysR family n=1 Tax=Nitrosomonas marina TaxID=917 RepID=A0A1I0G9A3_9PROT|nr:LysR substrate-binding domain-containing protein [Nitrosomonas marina]SET66501.1 DNA-binding transcriptional regulator, LysR family [Nitrosomonas marina]